jgi:methionyl-tRNA formyltransferase
MRIVFFGSPETAVPSLKRLLNEGHQIELIFTQPDRPSGRGKKFTPSAVKKAAEELGIPVYQSGKIRRDKAALEKIQEIDPDLIVVIAFGQIIPSSIIFSPKYNSINVHYSLLPKYRGASPVQWAILKGEEKTGITIFELNEKMDEGDVLTKKETPIFPHETAFQLEQRLSEMGMDLLIETISGIQNIKKRKQDDSLATYAPLLKKEDGRIDWKNESTFIERQVRAFTPWPSAFTFFQKKRLKILKGRTAISETEDFSPGQVVHISKDGIHIMCGGKSCYVVENLQPENKKPMDAYSYTLGAQMKSGDSFD